MHIAWLGKKSPFCGNVTYGREVTEALLNRGYQVSFFHFAQEEDTSEEQHPERAEIFLPFLYTSQVYTIPSPKSSKVLVQALQELQPDIVHASLTLSPLDFRLPEICEELNLPLVATFHAPFDGKLRNLKSSTQLLTYQFYAPFLANYDKVIVFSRQQANLLNKLGVPSERLAIIPNGVDADKYSPGTSQIQRQFGAQRLFAYLGRIAPEKNVEALLKAWKQVDMGEESRLLIVGDGPLAASLKPFYDKEDGILWLGFVADEAERIDILRGVDAFILPSYVEGLSLALLEAMACGAACVATDVGADEEVLEGGAGIVMKTPGVTSQLKTILPLLRDHPELLQILGQKGRQRILERYTLNQNITLLETLYAEILPR
jgi:glycosyltransferase involved in cell wall biosynthesis